MKSAVKRYNTAYKKRVLERDTYLPLLSPKGIIQCSGCGAFYYDSKNTRSPIEKIEWCSMHSTKSRTEILRLRT